MKRRFLNFFILISLVQLNVVATNYYVSPTGSNSNSGTSPGSPWLSVSYACSHVTANAGHIINLSAGTFTENNIITIPSGVSLIGAGSSNTTIVINHYYTITDYTQWKSTTYHPEHFVIQMNGSNQTIKGFSLNGQSRACVGGVYAQNAVNCVFDDLNIQNFRISGIFLEENSSNTEIKNCYIKNNAMADTATGDTGNILYQFSYNLSIHDNYIEEQGALSNDLGGYGIKRAQMWQNPDWWNYNNNHFHENMKIYNNTIIVPTVGAWNNGQAPAISIECCGGQMKNCEIYNNNVNNHMSLVGNYKISVYSGKACRVHHNNYNLGHGRYAYAIEANVPGLEIDHNFFNGGLNPIAQWENRTTTDFYSHTIHHNIFYDNWNNQAAVNYMAAPIGGTGFQFYNNLIVDNNGISKIFNVGNFTNVNIRNNIFTSTYGSRGNIWGSNFTGTVSNNCFYNITAKGTNTITSNPLITLSGNKPDPFFQLQSGSPAINSGVVIAGITDGYAGSNPDLGAFESAVSAWTVGYAPQNNLTTVVDIIKYEKEMTVFPNPVKNSNINLRLTGYQNDKNVKLFITDISGKEVYCLPNVKLENDNQLFKIDNQQFQKGLYTITVCSGNNVKSIKIIVN